MCGLVGIAGPRIFEKDAMVLKTLLYLDVLRGEDSTGLGLVYGLNDDEPTVTGLIKSVGQPDKLYVEHEEFFDRKKLIDRKDLNVVIGHNRFKTQGAISADNAHPFDFPNVIGAHNGTVPRWSLRDFHEAKKFDVDSQIIFSHLSYTQDIQKVWDDADGAMALVWWDKVRSTLNFARNKERPLWWTQANNGTVYWASEPWMLNVAMYQAGIKGPEPRLVEVDSHYVFTIGKEGVKLAVNKLTPFTYKIKTYSTGYGNNTNLEKDPLFLEAIEMQKVANKYNTQHYLLCCDITSGKNVLLHVPNVADNLEKAIEATRSNKVYILKEYYENWVKTDDIHIRGSFTHLKPCNLINDIVNAIDVDDGDKKRTNEDKKDDDEFHKSYGKGYQNIWLLKEVWLQRTDPGCSNCGGHIDWEDRDNVVWWDNVSPCCPDCKDEVNTILAGAQDLQAQKPKLSLPAVVTPVNNVVNLRS